MTTTDDRQVESPSIYQARPGFCRRGLHEMTEANTKIHTKGWKICRACRAAAGRRDAVKNSERRLAYRQEWCLANAEKISDYKRASYRKIREAINAYKAGKPCTDCGQSFPSYVMDFDHVRGVKRFNVGLAKNLNQLESEIAKCELVCANCHRIRTWTRDPERFLRGGRRPKTETA